MAILNDYYAILQVHFLAEQEVIESAYKRLAKKYHPDVNRSAGADARMKKINEAYETLSDTGKRRAYDAQHIRRPEIPRRTPDSGPRRDTREPEITCPDAAVYALRQYFNAIESRDFQSAYALITEMDKKK
ncbi:MAG: J domain-containing protein, partial [Clostridiales bacterium]|nr:J domain-containing protein [Clostridiales bacterium]